MRILTSCFLLMVVFLLTGCTEMRVEGDAKVFQSSAVGTIVRVVLGLGLIVLGVLSLVGSVLPNKKPRNQWDAANNQGLSGGQRIALMLFGCSMGFMGLFLSAIGLLFPSKLHVTVYPDRVALASTYSQTLGREVVVPFAKLASVELRTERNIVGKLRTYLVLTNKDGSAVRQEAGNNERQAFETIRQALADYEAHPPANLDLGDSALIAALKSAANDNSQVASAASPSGTLAANSNPTSPRAASTPRLKRYEITQPIPEGYKRVSADTTMEVGSKLKACSGLRWWTVTVVAVNDDGTITCNWDDFPTSTYKMMREDLTIRAEPLTGSLVDSSAADRATAQATMNLPTQAAPTTVPSMPGSIRPGTANSSSGQFALKRYKITIPVPRGYSIVEPNTVVEEGKKLKACYASRWEFVTVVAVNEDGTISCNWDNYRAFTYRMVREDLIIADR